MTDFNVRSFQARIAALPTGARAPVAWFLDIDGVINVIGAAPGSGWPEYLRTGVVMEGLQWPVCYSPDLVRLLNQLHEVGAVQFRWLTTWEHDGPRTFAPAVGLRLGAWVAAEDRGISAGWWKLDAILEHLAGTTEIFIWTDDDIKQFLFVRKVVDNLQPEQALVICTDERKGLTPEDFDRILSCIEVALA